MLTKKFLDSRMKCKNDYINVEFFLTVSIMYLIKVAQKLYRYFYDRAVLLD